MKKRKLFLGTCIAILIAAFIGCYAVISPTVSPLSSGKQTVEGIERGNRGTRRNFGNSQSRSFSGSRSSQGQGQIQGNSNGNQSSDGQESTQGVPPSNGQNGTTGSANSNQNNTPSMPNESMDSHMGGSQMGTLQKSIFSGLVLIIVCVNGILIITKLGKITIKEALNSKKRLVISATSVGLITFIISLSGMNAVKNSSSKMPTLPNGNTQNMPWNNSNGGTQGNSSDDGNTKSMPWNNSNRSNNNNGDAQGSNDSSGATQGSSNDQS